MGDGYPHLHRGLPCISESHAAGHYVVPGLLLITLASAVQGTSIMVAMDLTGPVAGAPRCRAAAPP